MIEQIRARRPEHRDNPVRKVIHLWRTRDIQLLELFFSTFVLPFWSAWLIYPFASDSFANPAFRVLSTIAREEVWGLTGLITAAVWAFGILEEVKGFRLVGSFVMSIIFWTVTWSLWKVAPNSPGVPMYGSVAIMAGLLHIRQRWGIGAGEP